MMWSSQRIRTRGMKMGLLGGKCVSRGKHTLTLFEEELLGKKKLLIAPSGPWSCVNGKGTVCGSKES